VPVMEFSLGKSPPNAQQSITPIPNATTMDLAKLTIMDLRIRELDTNKYSC